MKTPPKVAVKNVSMRFGDVLVLERLNLDIAAGTFCTIVGASGCGKSTFLQMLLSNTRPTGGAIELDGVPLPEWTPSPTPTRRDVVRDASRRRRTTSASNASAAPSRMAG